jgi:ABC-type branched-subunit amino acid transport system permease subunit
MEEVLFRKPSRTRFLIGYAILAFFFLVFPFYTPFKGLVQDIIIWTLFAVGFNLTFGFTGMVSLAHGVFFGVAAYTVGMLSIFWTRSAVTIPIGIAVGTFTGFITGYVSLKRARIDVHRALRIAYLVLISIAASRVALWLFLSPLGKYSGAEMGLLGFPNAPLRFVGDLSLDTSSRLQVYLIVGIVALVMTAWLHRMASSPAGLIMKAIRENELRVSFLGYNTFRFKLLIYVISSFVASVAGCLYLFRSGFISTDPFDFTFTTELVVICLIGGRNAFFGPLIGTVIFLTLKDLISSYTASWSLWLAVLLILSVLYLPNGLASPVFSAPRLLLKWMKKERPSRVGSSPPVS